MLPIEPVYKVFTDRDGNPLENGYVYFGLPNLNPVTSPIAVYWDAAGTQPALQPLRTVGGYIIRSGTPANVFVSGSYSELVLDNKGAQVFYGRTSEDWAFGSILASVLGSSLIGFLQAGLGAILRTLQDKARESVSILDFGAVGGGADDTLAFEKALATGKKVLIPIGTWSVLNVALTDLAHLYGEGWGSIVKMLAGAAGGDFALAVNRGDGGTTSTADNKRNITLRDFQVQGPDAVPVFLEQCHLVHMSAVSDVLIERVKFVGFKGDGLYIGSGDSGTAERHNENVTVRKCHFDGINNENRNGISVIDCDGFLADDNYFVNCTKPSMPAAIDIEPNASLYHVIRNIKVLGNVFRNCRAAIVVVIPLYLTAPANKFIIRDNDAEGCLYGYAIDQSNGNASGGQLSQESIDSDVIIEANKAKNCDFPVFVRGAKGVYIGKNEFEDCENHAVVGDGSTNRLFSFDVSLDRNRFIRCGSVSQFGVVVDGVTGLRMRGNKFTDCGDGAAGSSAIKLNPSFPAAVTITEFMENEFLAPTGKTINAVVETGAGTATFDYSNVLRNSYGGLTSYFLGDSGTFTPVITGGTTVGNGGVYAYQYGRWSRSGVRCFYELSVSLTSHTGTGATLVDLNDIPFTSKNISGNHFMAAAATISNLNIGAGMIVGTALQNNSKKIFVYIQAPAGGASVLETLAVDSNFIISISGSFEFA
ncbi:MAG: right-handed parallel beta-helix repeat-containing protein [Pseudomonadota bacterium]